MGGAGGVAMKTSPAQEEFWDVTERLYYWTAKHTKAAGSARLLGPNPAGHVVAAILQRIWEAKVSMDAAYDAYKAFRDAHPGETFVQTRPDVQSIVDRRRTRRAAITKKRGKKQ